MMTQRWSQRTCAAGPDRVIEPHRIAALDERAAVQAGLTPLTAEPVGLLAAIRPYRSTAALVLGPSASPGGSPVHLDVPVTSTLLANGDETSALVLLPAPLQAGTYLLDLSFNRSPGDLMRCHRSKSRVHSARSRS
jgi:hypothetical protein